MLTLVACPKGTRSSERDRGAVDAPAGSTIASSASAEPHTSIPPAPTRRSEPDAATGPSDAEKAARRKYDTAMEAGRVATRDRDYVAAVAAFDTALLGTPYDPRALAERGYAKALSKDWAGADADLERAFEGTEDRALSAQIWFNIGLVAEAQGSGSTPERARLAFARSNALRPTKAAEAKLAGTSSCIAEIDREPHRAAVVASWSAAWDAMAARTRRDFPVDDTRPRTEAEVRRSICADGCNGKGPWTAHVGSGRSVNFAVVPTEGGKLALHELDEPEEFMCGPGQDDEYAFDPRGAGAEVSVVRVHVRHTIVTRGWEDGWSQHACHDTSWDEADFFLDVTKQARVLRVEESGTFGSAGRKEREVVVRAASGVVDVSGGGCAERISLR